MIPLQQDVPFFRAEAIRLYTVIMGIVFLLVKLLIRRVTRQLAAVPFDTKDAIAWFGVDLSVLCLSIWIAASLPAKLSLNSKETTLIYIFLTLLILIAAAVYKCYLKVSANVRPGFWYNLKVSGYILGCLFVGLIDLLGTAAAL